MSIVSGLFRSAGLGTLVDALESQGVIKAGERVLPTTTPEMFIGSTGVENLGKAGMFDAGQALDVMKAAEKDRLRLSETEWNAKYGPMNIAFDDPARKAMMEISDENVTFKKGIDLNKLSNKDYYGFDEIFNAETLKKAYPELSEMKILLNDNPNNPALAGFDPENNVIEFNRKSRAWNSSDPLGSAVHEIQHYVQQREALTQGESFSNVLQQNAEYVDSTKLLQDSLNKSADLGYNFLKQNPKKGFTEDNLIEAFQRLREPNGLSARKALEIGFKDKTLADKFIKFANNPELKTILDLKDMSTAAYNTAIGDYMRVAGETFARQTDQRRLLTMKDRSESPAMKAIDEDRINKLYKINTQNLTESSSTVPTVQANAGDFTINPGKTQRSNTTPTYDKAFDILGVQKGDTVLDFGAGMGLGSESARKRGADVLTFEPIPPSSFKPNFTNAADIPEAAANKVVNMNVLNVLPPSQRDEALMHIGRALTPGGEAVINVRGAAEVNAAKNKIKSEDGWIVGSGKERTFQKGFTQKELKSYVSDILGDGYDVESVSGLSGATVRIKKLQQAPTIKYEDPFAPTDIFADPFAPQIPQSTIPGI